MARFKNKDLGLKAREKKCFKYDLGNLEVSWRRRRAERENTPKKSTKESRFLNDLIFAYFRL